MKALPYVSSQSFFKAFILGFVETGWPEVCSAPERWPVAGACFLCLLLTLFPYIVCNIFLSPLRFNHDITHIPKELSVERCFLSHKLPSVRLSGALVYFRASLRWSLHAVQLTFDAILRLPLAGTCWPSAAHG